MNKKSRPTTTIFSKNVYRGVLYKELQNYVIVYQNKYCINFIFHRNATIDIVGTMSADTDVLYHKNFFLVIYIDGNIYRLKTNEIFHFQHPCYVMKFVINYLHEFGFFHQMLKLIGSGHYPELFPYVPICFFAINFLSFFLLSVSFKKSCFHPWNLSH